MAWDAPKVKGDAAEKLALPAGELAGEEDDDELE